MQLFHARRRALDDKPGPTLGSIRTDRAPGALMLTPPLAWRGLSLHPTLCTYRSGCLLVLLSVLRPVNQTAIHVYVYGSIRGMLPYFFTCALRGQGCLLSQEKFVITLSAHAPSTIIEHCAALHTSPRERTRRHGSEKRLLNVRCRTRVDPSMLPEH